MRIAIAIAIAAALSGTATADRIKDLTTIGGVRENHLTGFGLVVGLDGTGDDTRSPMVKSGLTKMLKRLGVTVEPADIKAKNVAAVMITAELPPFAKPGMPLDIHVSSVGNAKSLTGGMLLAAPLKGADTRTYAIAQGSLSIGGFAAGGAGATAKAGHTLVGTIPGGAIIEVGAPTVLPSKQIALVLKEPDFTTATRMRDAIVAVLGENSARVGDAATVVVPIPKQMELAVGELITKLEAIEVEPDVRAKVIIDERTGTVVIGEAVRLRTAAITFGALTVEVSETPEASQPNALGAGDTKVLDRTNLKVKEDSSNLKVLSQAATVGDVAAALAALGAKPRELVGILRALKASGALRADLETM